MLSPSRYFAFSLWPRQCINARANGGDIVWASLFILTIFQSFSPRSKITVHLAFCDICCVCVTSVAFC